jgi:TonB-dependent starch-binding outer membrane protein SusC
MEISISGGWLHFTTLKRLPSQLLRIMRLTALLLFIVSMHVSAHSYSQTVSFKGKNVPLETVFASFEKQTGLSFFFNYALIKDIKPVTVDVREMPLEDALNIILKEQGLNFYRSGKTIFIVKQEAAAAATPSSATGTDAKQVNVSGKVMNQQGEVLAGASVEVKNGKRATLTDAKGVFELKNVPIGAVLVVSYTGYQKKEIDVNQADLAMVILTIANNQLDQAQVIAYGATTERLSTGNVTTVTAKEIEQQPVSNPLLALEGRVPGLFITQANGMPGTGVTVRIQGQNSISEGNDPFYVVDGVPYSSQGLQQFSTAGTGSPLDFINPSDIESITVLKDADATAIYGSRAANGAILITTKKGQNGATTVNFNLQNGWGHITREVPLLNTQQYLQMRHEAINNDGLTVQPTDYDLNGTWDTTRSTDWQKVLIGNTSQYSNLNGTVSGGTAMTQYLIGGTYHRETTIFPGDFNDQKGSLHVNLMTSSANKKFHFQLTGNYLTEKNRLPGQDLTNDAIQLAPDAPPLYNKDGSLNWALDQNGNSTWLNINPLATNYNTYINQNSNLVGSVVLSYQVMPGLEIKSNFGYNKQEVDENAIFPLTSTAPANRAYVNRTARDNYNNNNSWIIEPQANYKKVWGRGKLEALVGSTIQQNNTNEVQIYGVGFTSDLLLEDPQAAATNYVGSTFAEYKYNALFTRVGYNWDDKYLINLTVRRDGSSRFGPDKEFHDFEAVGAGWIFSKERIFQDNLSFLSFGKLKASYGTTGNDQIGDYQFLSLYNTLPSLPYQGIVSVVPQGLTNPNLQWEETKKMELGMDLSFLKDRIFINATYFRNRSSNELLNYALPVITGFSGITENLPATVQNAGWEFTIRTINVRTKQFTWSTHINLTIPKDKLVSFPGLANTSYAYSYEIGKPILGVKDFHFLGVNDTTGIYEFADSKGNATSTPVYGTDNSTFISLMPKFYGGFENNFTYKGFELDFLFQFTNQLGPNYAFGNYPGAYFSGNQPTYVLNRWQHPGDHASIQRYNTNYAYNTQWSDAESSDAANSSASYIRLKNFALSWQLPGNWKTKAHLQIFKVFLQGQNLLTITHYKGMDPESPGGGQTGLAPLRILTTGIQVAF